MTDDAEVLSVLQLANGGSLSERTGIEVLEAGRERIVGTMPVEGNTQPYGVLHGGASCVLAETLASIGSALVGWPDRLALGVEINATHHRPARSGVVTGVATPVHVGKTLATWDVAITREDGKRVCTARVTCALREP